MHYMHTCIYSRNILLSENADDARRKTRTHVRVHIHGCTGVESYIILHYYITLLKNY